MDELSRHLEYIRTYLPKYLSPRQQDNLFRDLRENFPHSTNSNKVYVRLDDTSVFYQGDVIIDIPFATWNSTNTSFDTKYYTAAILSNTCDINPQNTRLQDGNITFALVITLAKYVELLKKKDIEKARVDSLLDRLKKNEITNLFYLPKLRRGLRVILEESLVRFDVTVSLPLSLFTDGAYDRGYSPGGDRKITLSDYGFYLLLFKLSVHCCRFREDVFRSE